MNPPSPHPPADTIPIHPTIDLPTLNASRELFLNKTQAATGLSLDKLVIGAAIFRHEADGTSRLLLLKRADNETYFTGVFEIPGGKVDADEPSINHAVVREVLEETGLNVTEFLAELDFMLYTTEKKVSGEVVRKRAMQLNYVVKCEEGEVRLPSGEYSEAVWVGEGGLGDFNITEEMREVVVDAFGPVGEGFDGGRLSLFTVGTNITPQPPHYNGHTDPSPVLGHSARVSTTAMMMSMPHC